MNAALSSNASSEPLANLVRQMLTTEAPSAKRRREPELKLTRPPVEDDGFPAVLVKQPAPGSFLKSASGLSVLAVLSYLLLLAV